MQTLTRMMAGIIMLLQLLLPMPRVSCSKLVQNSLHPSVVSLSISLNTSYLRHVGLVFSYEDMLASGKVEMVRVCDEIDE